MRLLVCRNQASIQPAFQDITLCADRSNCSRLGNKVWDEHHRISGHKSPRRKIMFYRTIMLSCYTQEIMNINHTTQPQRTLSLSPNERCTDFDHPFLTSWPETYNWQPTLQHSHNFLFTVLKLHTNRELLRKNVQQSGNWPASKQELITKHFPPSSSPQNP
jgi:hypothetical protein